MKIIHFIDELKMGGAQTHLYTMCKASKEVSPEIEFVVISLFGEGIIKEWLEDIGIEVIIFDFKPLMKKRKYLTIINTLKKTLKIENPDSVISHLTWSRLLANTSAWLSKTPNRIVFEQGDIFFSSFPFRILNYLSQFTFKKTIVCSNALKQWVTRTHLISKNKIEVYHNCVDPSKFDDQQSMLTEISLPKVDFLFAGIGTLGTGVNKRFDICIEAIAKANKLSDKKIGLVICGDGEQKIQLQKLIEKLNMSDEIYLLGNQPNIPSILKKCNAFCHASPFEPFGIVAIEAMAMKLPVILPKSGGIQEIITDGKEGFLYESLNTDKFAEKIIQLISFNTSEFNRLSENAFDTVHKKFTAHQYIKRFNKQFFNL